MFFCIFTPYNVAGEDDQLKCVIAGNKFAMLLIKDAYKNFQNTYKVLRWLSM